MGELLNYRVDELLNWWDTNCFKNWNWNWK